MREPGAGEGASPTRSAEIEPDFSIVKMLKGEEENASTKKFRRGKENTPDEIKRAANMAIAYVGTVLDMYPNDQNRNVVTEMLKLGAVIDLGRGFSISARVEDDPVKIGLWNSFKNVNSPREIPAAITVKIGPALLSYRDFPPSDEFRLQGYVEKVLETSQEKKPEVKREVWRAIEDLGNLTPKDIVRAFRKSIEDGQEVVMKQQKRASKEELNAFRRGK